MVRVSRPVVKPHGCRRLYRRLCRGKTPRDNLMFAAVARRMIKRRVLTIWRLNFKTILRQPPTLSPTAGGPVAPARLIALRRERETTLLRSGALILLGSS